MARGDGEERRNLTSSLGGSTDPVPQGLKEVMELLNLANRSLEDSAVEWQSNISRKQWRILDAKSVPETPWEQSLLARTYFVDQNLDENFQKLLNRAKNLVLHLKTFFALLRGEHPIQEGTRDAQNQCSGDSSPVDEHPPRNPIVAPLDFSLLDDNNGQSTGRRRSKRLAANALSNVRQSFADLIKAKIDLDTKFLGFEAILNSPGQTNFAQTDGVKCLCQICTNILGSAIDVSPKSKVPMTRTRSKRLTRTPKSWNRKPDKKPEMSIVKIASQSIISTQTTEDPSMES